MRKDDFKERSKALLQSLNKKDKYENVIVRLGLIFGVVSDLLRVELLKVGIKREEIGRFQEPKIEDIIKKGVLNFHQLVFLKRKAQRAK